MDDVEFTWDPAKAAANLSKHGVSLEDASTVFRNPLAKVLPDPTHSEQEQRSLIIGHSARGRLLLVVFTESNDRIRIISARDASARERREYEEHS
ncbi:MAG TPA: BrnT family toxin [Vicinamibacteria bacterium]|nr:BrnT family toxin [Vicinamibacteria bacterium]